MAIISEVYQINFQWVGEYLRFLTIVFPENAVILKNAFVGGTIVEQARNKVDD